VQWFDSRSRYGLVSRVLHWGMALIFAWQFMGMAVKLIVGRAPLTAFLVGTHQPIGAVLFALMILRLLWALINWRRRPLYEVGTTGRLAFAGHLALYALMVIIPTLGLLRRYGQGEGFAPFGIPLFDARGTEIAWMIQPAELLHRPLAWSFLVLILGHVLMVLVHRFHWRDDTLKKMA